MSSRAVRGAMAVTLMAAAIGMTTSVAAQPAAEPASPESAVQLDTRSEQQTVAQPTPPKPAPKIAIAPPPPHRSPTLRSDFELFYALGFTMVGVGGAATVAGALTGALALGIDKELEEACGPDRRCDASLEDDNERRLALADASTALVILGPALFFGGITVLVWNASTAYDAPVDVQVGPTSASVSLRF